MKTQSQIVRAFDSAQPRLADHGITIISNGAFLLMRNDVQIAEYDTVDGLTAYADALGAA